MFISFELKGFSASHIFIHFMNCVFILTALNTFVFIKNTKTKLVLDSGQRQILQELSEGKQQKEIECFSKNTITKKLHDAMLKNNCATKEELLTLFIKEKEN